MDEKKIEAILLTLLRVNENLKKATEELIGVINDLRIELPDNSLKKDDIATREDILNSYINKAKEEEKNLSDAEKDEKELFLENFGGER